MERVLCIKIASRGDLLLAAPAFKKLKELHSHVDLVVGETCKDVADHLPYFQQVFTINDQNFFVGNLVQKIETALGLRSLMKGYDQVIIFHRDWRYGLLAKMAGVPTRKGFANSFLSHPYHPPSSEHHADQYLKMSLQGEKVSNSSDTLLAGLWEFKKEEPASYENRLAQLGFEKSQGEWIGLGFGGGKNVKTRTDLKSWPLTHYLELAEMLVAKGFHVLWVGDREDAEKLGQSQQGLNLAGKLTVAETAWVLSQCGQVITNDTLALHLSEIMGTPTIGIFGPTEPSHYRPRGPQSECLSLKLSCSPCHQDGYFPPCPYNQRCMRELTVASVVQAIERKR
jgi:ADP-heptose:LPS heptosyltransferase